MASGVQSDREREEGTATPVQSTKPLRLDPQVTAPLVNFLPPACALPFREPPTIPMLPTAPLSPLVPPLPQRATRRSRLSFRTMAALLLLAFQALVLGYLVATR
jgi:hypothetical protein